MESWSHQLYRWQRKRFQEVQGLRVKSVFLGVMKTVGKLLKEEIEFLDN